MKTHDHKILRNFFACYFNQDWVYESGTPKQVVRNYMRMASRSDVIQLPAIIMQFIGNEQNTENQTLENKLYRELGCYYMPSADGLTVKDWLISVAEQLRTGINEKDQAENGPKGSGSRLSE